MCVCVFVCERERERERERESKGHIKCSKAHQGFRFVAHLSHLHGPHEHRN